MPANPTPEELAAWRVPESIAGIEHDGCVIDRPGIVGEMLTMEEALSTALSLQRRCSRLIDALEAERAKVKRLRVFAQGIAGDQDLEPGYWTDAQKALEETE